MAQEAISHMFRVGSGLDSQILGDFEIISQLKTSAKLSRKYGLLNHFSERLINAVIQASKRIKTETDIEEPKTVEASSIEEPKTVEAPRKIIFEQKKNNLKHLERRRECCHNRGCAARCVR